MNKKLISIRVLSVIALLLSFYITWTSLSDAARLAGCGEGSGCEAVLQTKWSSWFGIPVSFGAILVYGALFVFSFRVSVAKPDGWLPLLFFAVLAGGSALWFVGLQAFLIRSYCIYCTLVHLCGIVILILILKTVPFQKQEPAKKKKAEPAGIPAKKIWNAALIGISGVIVLAAGQMKSQSAVIPVSSDDAKPGTSVVSRTVRLLNGSIPVNAGEFPVLGARDPERVIAHLFDYTCPACRKLHSDLLHAQESGSEAAGLVMIPMPLDAVCNPGVSQTQYIHLNACTFARLGLAIWRTKPSVYEAYDHFMFQTEHPPTAEAARGVADQLAGSENIKTALGDPRLEDTLRTGINIFYSPFLQRKVLPMLVTPEKAIYGIPEQTELTAIFHHTP